MMSTIATWTLTYWVHSALLIGLAWLLGHALRHRPDVMSGVWKAALVGGLFTATAASAGLGAVQVDVTHAPLLTTAEPVADASADLVEIPPSELAALPIGLESPRLVALAAEPVSPSPVAEPDPVAPPTPPTAAASAPPAWMVVVSTLTLLGFAFGLVSVAHSWLQLRRRLHPPRPIVEGPLVAMLVRLRRLGRVRRHVGLFVAERAQVPMAMGVVHPRIVLPPRAATELPVDEQRSMLAHELAHVFRSDPAWRIVALLVERGLFFQPLNRLAARRLAECAEYLADDWAARYTRQPIALASCLTQIAGWVGGKPDRDRAIVAAMAGAGGGSQLRGRVMRLLDPPRAGRGAPLASLGIAAAMVAVIAIAPSVSSGKGHQPVVVGDGQARVTEHGDGTIVVDAGDGREIVIIAEHADAPTPTPAGDAAPATADRESKRKAARANRQARRKLDKAMRKARKEGRVAPSRAEIDAILSEARAEGGRAEARAEGGPAEPARSEGRERVIIRQRAQAQGDHSRGKGKGHSHGHGRGHTRSRGKGHAKHGDGGTRQVVVHGADGTMIQIEIVEGEPTRVRKVRPAPAPVDVERIQRRVEQEVRREIERAMREVEHQRRREEAMRKIIERKHREAARGHAAAMKNPFAGPRPAAPTAPSMKNPFDGPPPPAPPAPSVKNPFGAPPPPAAPRGPNKNPFAAPRAPASPPPPAKNPFSRGRAPAPAVAPGRPTPPDVVLQ